MEIKEIEKIMDEVLNKVLLNNEGTTGEISNALDASWNRGARAMYNYLLAELYRKETEK